MYIRTFEKISLEKSLTFYKQPSRCANNQSTLVRHSATKSASHIQIEIQPYQTCVARLYNDAIRRMGNLGRLKNEQNKKLSLSHSRAHSQDLTNRPKSALKISNPNIRSRSKYMVRDNTKTTITKDSLRSSSKKRLIQPKENLKGKSVCKFKSTKTIPNTKRVLKLLEKIEQKTKNAIAKNVDCMEKIYNMRPNKYNADLLSKAIKNTSIKQKTKKVKEQNFTSSNKLFKLPQGDRDSDNE